ncbi:complement C3-like [Anneissia japonica]|uniref:complement C3-like n=1 Tax=Anneissia japonica TaxID=1529436 RepID=UPI0014256996|nr:complement C3-like [Anneissia japonica]
MFNCAIPLKIEVIYNSLAATKAEECAFFVSAEMSLVRGDNERDKVYTMRISVKYQKELEGRTDMVIVEVGLFSGFTPVEATLKTLEKSENVPVERYEISDRKVILYLEYLDASEIVNLDFRVKQSFEMKNIQSARVAVYDYYFPEKKCTAFYNPKDDQTELRQFCTADMCVCAAGACPKFFCPKSKPGHTYNQLYHEYACGPKSSIDYVFEVVAEGKVTENGFTTLTASVKEVMKKGKDTIEAGSLTRLFSMKSSCENECDWMIGRKYLIMGKDGLSYKDGNFIKYKYLLDATSYIEKWPKKGENGKRAKSFNKLKKTLGKEGCAA